MPFPPGPQSLPDCATQFLYQIGGLYYYATIDCMTGATGVGVTNESITPEGCDGLECTEGSTITPLFKFLAGGITGDFDDQLSFSEAREAFVKLLFGLGKDCSCDERRFGRSNNFKKRLLQAFQALEARSDVGPRRSELASSFNTLAKLQRLYALPPKIRRVYFRIIAQELRKVRVGDNDAIEGVLLVRDEDLDVDTISVKPKHQWPFVVDDQYDDSVEEPMFVGGITSIYLKAPVDGEDVFVYFRLQDVTLTDKVTGDTLGPHHIGQQVQEQDLTDAGITVENLKAETFVDRHKHFHVLSATPDGGVETEYLVYTEDDLSRDSLI